MTTVYHNTVTRLAAALGIAMCVLGVERLEALTASDVYGIWQHPENGSRVEFYACGTGLCARIVQIADGQRSDDKNPDPAKRQRPIVGLVILSDAHETGPLAWAGSLYNRADGHAYSGKVTLKQPDQLVMTGCTAIVICRSVTWKRVKATIK